ncbi:hypothetical protein NUW54_g13935 [Trametes sanguinea]|uniref:Uncharacterized protein n=1 Tax=Trametes sanguinea TaxID=158606 RepID=A0ACC1MG53_9APHY|nr:hypothetical protein NUW54_g13935 [Trametes sanguinea]
MSRISPGPESSGITTKRARVSGRLPPMIGPTRLGLRVSGIGLGGLPPVIIILPAPSARTASGARPTERKRAPIHLHPDAGIHRNQQHEQQQQQQQHA